MEFQQKKGSNRTRFEFLSDQLEFDIQDKSGTASFRVAYTALPYRVHEYIERNEWLRNVGLLWLIIGVLLTGWRATQGVLLPSMWIPVGLACLVWFRITIVRFSTLQTEHGRIFVIRDSQHDKIVAELLDRRVEQLKRAFAFVDHENDPAKEIGKFQWLLDNRVIDQAEFDRLKSEAESPALTVQPEQPERHSIN